MLEIRFKKEGDIITFEIPLKEALMSLRDGTYTMLLKMLREQRSKQQNRYYWACLGYIGIETGYIIEEMDSVSKKKIVDALHEHFKERFLSHETVKSTKDKRRKLKIKGSTKETDPAEFKEYMDKIKTLHPYLPGPDTDGLLKWIDDYYFM